MPREHHVYECLDCHELYDTYMEAEQCEGTHE